MTCGDWRLDLLLSSKAQAVIKAFCMVLSILIPVWIFSCLVRLMLVLNSVLQWELLVGTLPSAQSAVLKEATDTHVFKAALFLLNLLN